MLFGSSECQSVETYVELAEGGGEEWICEKNWECYDTGEEYLTKSDWYKEMCSVEDLKNKRKELRDAGIIPTEKPEPLTLKNSWLETRPQYPGDIYIDDTYIPEKDIPSWKEVAELDSNHPWLKTKPKVTPPKYCHAIIIRRK